MKKFGYLTGCIILSMVLWAVYLFLKQSNSQNLKLMLLLIGCVILARIVITPIVAILVHRHDRLKEQREQEGGKHEPKISILTYLKRALIFFGLFLLVEIVQIPVQIISDLQHPSLLMVIGIGVLYLLGFGIAIWFAWRAYRSVYRQKNHGLNKSDWKLIGKALVFFYVVEIGLSFLNTMIYKQNGTANNDLILSLIKSNPIILGLMSFTMVFCSPVLEELVFRGYLIKGFFPKSKPLIPMLVSGILFSIGHVSSTPISFLIYMSLGMILAYIYLKQDKIEVSIGLHFLNNLIATILMIIGILAG